MFIHLTSHPYSFISWAIRKLTDSKVSHVGIEDFERPLVLHSTSIGLHYSYLTKFIKDNKVIYSFKFLPMYDKETEKDVKKCFLKMLKMLENPYDYLAIIGFIPFLIGKKLGFKINNTLGKRNALFCSEALYVFLEYCIHQGVIKENILEEYSREEFSPEDAFQLMSEYPNYFEEVI